MNNKLLASLAVFRVLYNSERDVYDVISKFILEVIIHKNIYCFEAIEMRTYLDDLFDFQLPEGVIKASSNRLNCIFIENKKFVVDKTKLSQYLQFNSDEEKNKSIYEDILNSLIEYININSEMNIDKDEEKKIEKEFSEFLLHGSMNNGHSNLISKFIVSNKENEIFIKNINLIKEGVLLYTGLIYTPDTLELGSWKSKITIYLDVEILFHAVGYNGELFKNIFDDFNNLVKDINKNKFLISLKYFSETKREIENFFAKAEYIVAGQDKLNSTITAMDSIVTGCNTKSDIVERKIRFYDTLKKYNILEDDYIIEYDEGNYKYNIISSELEQELRIRYSQHEIDYALKLLNNMSIKREKRSVNNFENIGAILLSANSKILKIAKHDDVKEQGKVPLATNIDFLTNKFWFKLNKGFGTNDYPKTFSIFTKAQIILASHINDNLNKQFSKIQQKIKSNTFTEEQALQNLIFLKENVKKPEDITSESIDEVYLLLNENSIEEIVNHHEYLKNEVEKQKNNKLILEEELIKKTSNIDKISKEFKNLQEHLINEKQERIVQLEKIKIKLDSFVEKKLLRFKIFVSISILVYYIIIICLIMKFGWDNVEPIAYFMGVLPVGMSLLNMIFSENSFSFKNFIGNKRNKIREKIYKENEFNENNIEKLKVEVQELNLKGA